MASFEIGHDSQSGPDSAVSSPTMGTTPVTPIAVIGMACRLPGGIDSPEQLWEALLRGDDLVTEFPPDRWDVDEYYDPEPGVPGRSVSKWGGLLDDVAGFDSEFFGISESEAIAIDPQQRLLLETSWEAMEHAGLAPETVADSLTGVFVGLTHGDYALLAADTGALEGPYGNIGTNFSQASGRIAYALGVHGPAATVDTACSSGLFAVHMACRSLHRGRKRPCLRGRRLRDAGTAKVGLGIRAGLAFSHGTMSCVRRRGGRVRVLRRLRRGVTQTFARRAARR